MLTDKSRYAKLATVEARAAGDRKVTALKLRRLPPVAGEPQRVVEGDRLDLLAQRQLGDGTAFWRIADANTALQANDLVAVTGDTLDLPRR